MFICLLPKIFIKFYIGDDIKDCVNNLMKKMATEELNKFSE